MSNYKYPTPQLLFKGICDAIRAKTGSTNKIAHQDIPDSIDGIIAKEEECEIAARELSNIIYGSEVKVLDSKYILNIASYKFCGSGLTTIDLPKCTYIDSWAFWNCTNLTTIILSNNQVATLGNINAFYSSPIVNVAGYVYVPDNLVDSYKTATNWSTYANRIKPISELSN